MLSSLVNLPYTEERYLFLYSPVVILDTVGIVVVIGDEGCPLKYAGAGAAAETVGMETLAHCLQHTVCDPLPTSGTHRQGILRRNRKAR